MQNITQNTHCITDIKKKIEIGRKCVWGGGGGGGGVVLGGGGGCWGGGGGFLWVRLNRWVVQVSNTYTYGNINEESY